VIIRALPGVLVALVLASLTGACGGRQGHAAAPSRWVQLVANGRITASLDTSTVRHDSLGTLVLVRFDYAEPEPVPGDSTASFDRMEAHLRVRCAQRQAQSVDMRLVPTDQARAGQFKFEPVGTGEWQPFERHDLTPAVFDPLCKQLAIGPGAPGA
jgi:hypothetical protein